ncbi:ribonuclease III [Verrucomicrobia bacterium]|nr:ribonuclease III [Verrucomicrobiota bacterium]
MHDLTKLQEALGYSFSDSLLPLQALTHKSFANEQGSSTDHNERLEFLGDAVLELAISDFIFRRYPDIPEGGLTRIRAEVVSEQGLSELARGLELGEELKLGKGEYKSGGQNKPSVLSDAFEALLGAIYLDGGMLVVQQVVERIFSAAIERAAHQRYGSDYKTCLQERLQARYNELPCYELVETQGPDHDRVFFIEVRYQHKLLGKGRGHSKKRAEQQAAAAALEHPLLREL